MISRIVFGSLTTLALLSACHTNKKSQPSATTNNEPAIQLDTISVVANDPIKRDIYRASNERTNDLLHTRLEVNFDWVLSRMNGKATLQIKPYFYPVKKLFLNARGMDIQKIEVYEQTSAGERIAADAPSDPKKKLTIPTYTYENDSLKIDLGRVFSEKETYTVVIDYVAKPNELKSNGGSSAITEDKGLYFVNPTGENPYKMPQIWTQGETQANSVWFPTIDSPNEKMTQEILMTVDDRYTTLSNGALIRSEKLSGGKRLDHWKLDQPHAPYLAMMAVGEFKKITDTPWKEKEISYYVEKDYEHYAKAIFGDTREMIEFYSGKLGVPYAWPKYAQIVARDYVSGAMENTSATLHGDFMVYQTAREMIDGKKGNAVIAHELFHQWFGDLVTCESWSNLPLNESFATYGEYLWEEYKSGREEADYHHWQSAQGYLRSEKEVNLIRFDYYDKEDMFDAFSYNKGGQILHMLRKVVGDDAFFASLKNYLETNKFKSVEIHNLRLAFEETTGKDLNWFFNQWFLSKGRPKLTVSKKYNQVNKAVELTVEQTQDLKKFPLYTLPLEVDLYVSGQVERKHLVITEQRQTFTLAIGTEPELVNFDAERQLLADINYPKSQQEYVYQYYRAPLYGDRYEALKEIEKNIIDQEIFVLFKEVVKEDKNFALRNYAIQRLEKVSDDRTLEVKTILTTAFLTDKNTLTRAKALATLNRMFPGNPDVTNLNESALKEQSYAICGEALEALTKSNPKLAMERAIRFENETGKDVLIPIANLYANHGGDGQIHFYRNGLRYINGYDLMPFCAAYAKAAKSCSIPENALLAANDLEMIGKGAGKYLKYATSKGIKDLLTHWELKERTMLAQINTPKKENKNTGELEKELKKVSETKERLSTIYNRSK